MRTDIYSLGVVLYELLTGTTPFDRDRLRSAALDEVMRIIREEEPPKPSTKISSTGQGSSRPGPQKSRVDIPIRLVRGELDWIAMKALEKDRGRRYQTANGLAEDIQRYLQHEPVVACPPSWLYRVRKFSRRYRAAMVAGSLVTLALVGGLITTTWQAKRANDATQEALENLKRARDAQIRERDERRRADDNFWRARHAVDEYFTLVSESTLFDEAGMAPLRTELLESALRYYEEFAGQSGDDPEQTLDLAAAHERIAWIRALIGEPDAMEAFQRCLGLLEELLRRDAAPKNCQSYDIGIFTDRHGSNAVFPEETLAIFERGINIFGQLTTLYPQVRGFQHELAGSYLMAAHFSPSDVQEKRYTNARHIWKRLLRDNPEVIRYAVQFRSVSKHLADFLDASGRRADAAQILQEAIDILRTTYSNSRAELADMLVCLADLRLVPEASEKTEPLLREAETIYRSVLENAPTRSPRSMPLVRLGLAETCTRLSSILWESGRNQLGEEMNNESVRVVQTLIEQEPTNVEFYPALGRVFKNHGDYSLRTGRSLQAAASLKKAIEIEKQTMAMRSAPHPHYFSSRENMAYAQSYLAEVLTFRPSEAVEANRQALAIFQDLSAEFPDNKWYRVEIGKTLP